jgi:hypothetical protein
MILYIICWIGLGTLTKFYLDMKGWFKHTKTKEFDSKEPFKPIDNISKPIGLEHVSIDDIDLKYIHSISWEGNTKERAITDIEFRNTL